MIKIACCKIIIYVFGYFRFVNVTHTHHTYTRAHKERHTEKYKNYNIYFTSDMAIFSLLEKFL